MKDVHIRKVIIYYFFSVTNDLEVNLHLNKTLLICQRTEAMKEYWYDSGESFQTLIFNLFTQ